MGRSDGESTRAWPIAVLLGAGSWACTLTGDDLDPTAYAPDALDELPAAERAREAPADATQSEPAGGLREPEDGRLSEQTPVSSREPNDGASRNDERGQESLDGEAGSGRDQPAPDAGVGPVVPGAGAGLGPDSTAPPPADEVDAEPSPGVDAGVPDSTPPDADEPPADDPTPPRPACAVAEVEGPNGNCFVVVRTPQTWAAARNACRARAPGWDLAAIHSQAVDDFLAGLAIEEAWVGASDAQQEGTWIWVTDGSPFWIGDGIAGSTVSAAYERWNADEPNGGGNSDCARVVPLLLGAWADLECVELRNAICEGPRALQPGEP